MRFDWRSVVVPLLLAIVLAFSGQALAEEKASAAGGQRALLVGCTHYPNLRDDKQLSGPGNDVVLMRKLLVERFGFPDKSIVTLSEAAGQAEGEDKRPTRKNIEREFRRLAQIAKAADQVVILMAGHGSQQPEKNPPDPEYPEPDGLDETFLPADVGKWDGEKEAVANAIIDDELRIWTKDILAKGASVCFIGDSCHSGTLLRGGSGETPRELKAADLGIPDEELRKAQQRAAQRAVKARGAGNPSPLKLDRAERLVAIYAAQSSELTIEKLMPGDSVDRQWYGLLSYTLCQILSESKTPLTYTELVQRIYAQYAAWGRQAPTPLVEGADRDREVLGLREWPGRSRFLLETGDLDFKLNGGALHGLTVGSVLAVHAPAGQQPADKPLGYVRVTQRRTLEAIVEPCAYADLPANGKLPKGGRCELVYLDYGSMRLRVSLEENASKDQRLTQALKRIASAPNSLIELVKEPAKADWLVHFQDGKFLLRPAAGVDQKSGGLVVGLAANAEQLEKQLEDRLSQIARTRSLLAVTQSSASEQSRGGAGGVEVKVELLRFRDTTDTKGEPVHWQSNGIVLHTGDIIAFNMENRSKFSVDVSLMFVDSGYGIIPLFPLPATVTENRLEPGSAPFRTPRVRVTGDTVGQEHLVVIAVRAQGQPVDFTCLAEPTIERVRARGAAASRGSNSPLGRLFEHALYREGKSRGIAMGEFDNHSLGLLSWQVTGGARDPKAK